MTWQDGSLELNTAKYAQSLGHWLDSAIERVAERKHREVTENDLLAVLLSQRPDAPAFLDLAPDQRDALSQCAALLANHLAAGVAAADCLRVFDDLAEVVAEEINPFERKAWRDPVACLIESLPDSAGPQEFLQALFAATDSLPDGDMMTSLFDAPSIVVVLSSSGQDQPLFTEDTLAAEALTPRARFLLDQALANAAKAGQERCDAGDLLVAMVRAKDTYTGVILRRAGVSTTSPAATSYFATQLEAPVSPSAAPLPAGPDAMTPELVKTLENARSLAMATTGKPPGERELLTQLLATEDPKARHLADDVLQMNNPLVHDLLKSVKEPEIIEPALPTEAGQVRNATLATDPVVPRDDVIGPIIKVFFRSKNRVYLLHGERGTGTSTIPEVLAASIKQGKFPALSQCQVIAFDLAALAADAASPTSQSSQVGMAGLPGGGQAKYEAAAERVLAFMEAEPDRAYVIDGFGPYFIAHFAQCARRFANCTYRLVLTVDQTDFTALQAGSEPLTNFLEVAELAEPNNQTTGEIIQLAAQRIGSETGVSFNPKAVLAAQRMAADYLLSARFPAKAVSLLERAAAEETAEAAMNERAPRELDRAAIARPVASLTGLPIETILGTGQDKDYVDLLSTNLVGQEVAVEKVAGRLDLIQKSMVSKKLPAAVFIFAGLSGTGKSELAKQIAQIYSASRTMVSFAMANFGESHSVSGMIGSPPGYTGYEEGGPLINALNRDPYSVVLLDEVEKAHPDVWPPFLNLFDEGWVTDRRGVTAQGTKAFFVLTSNIGQYEIADMLSQGAPREEIEDMVMGLMPTFKHSRAGVPCFSPEFLGRVFRSGGVVAFNALSFEALLSIARFNFSKIAKDFQETHEGQFVCDEDVLEMLAQTIYDENDAVIRSRKPGYTGARRLQPLMDQYINNKLASKIRQLAGAPLVRVIKNGNDTEVIPVFDDGEAEALLSQRRIGLVGRVEQRFSQVVTAPDEVFAGLGDDQLLRLDRLLGEVGAIL
ncbi:MAG: AAA family ATPase [Micrococcales bacterium]|nr:AAA family ATPase [Micrococcales bacterium]